MTIKKTGSAHWAGNIKEGKGTVSTESGALKEQPYGFNTRFEGKPGTNPEELLGAAHAGCFSMALSLMLGNEGLTPDSIDTKAIVSLDKKGEGFAITAVHLDVEARIPETDTSTFERIATQAKEGCPVSQLFDTAITMSARLVN